MTSMVLMGASVLLPGDSHMSSSANEVVIIFGSLLAVILGIVIWAVYFRKGPRRHRHRQHPSHGQTASLTPQRIETNGEPPTGEAKRRRRVRRNQYPKRPQNPTLADTKGLPPFRTENPRSNSPSPF
jgi:hypothetical protein